MARLNEADRRPLAAPSIACTSTGQAPGVIVSSAALLDQITAKIIINVTVTGTVTFHMLDGTSVVNTFAVGTYIIDIQCDNIQWAATATVCAFANPS